MFNSISLYAKTIKHNMYFQNKRMLKQLLQTYCELYHKYVNWLKKLIIMLAQANQLNDSQLGKEIKDVIVSTQHMILPTKRDIRNLREDIQYYID